MKSSAAPSIFRWFGTLSHHASTAFMASYSSSGCCNNQDVLLNCAIDMYDEQVTSGGYLLASPFSQKALSF